MRIESLRLSPAREDFRRALEVAEKQGARLFAERAREELVALEEPAAQEA